MDLEQRMKIERECERLVTQYCHYVDHGEAAKIADQFTAEGVWASPGGAMNGRAEIRESFESRQANVARMSRHVCNNLLIEVIDEDHANGTVYLTLYRFDGDPGRSLSPIEGQPFMVGEYRDRFVRTEDGWRFAHREIEVSFAGNASSSG